MRSRFWLLWIALFNLNFAHASGSRLISFYLSPQSLVPSGQSALSLLAANEQQRVNRNQIRVESTRGDETKTHLVEYGTIATDIHVSEWALTQVETPLLADKPERRLLLRRLPANEHVQILAIKNEWAEVYVPHLKVRGFVRWMDLKTNYFDLGLYYLMVSTPLRGQPNFGAKALFNVPAGARVRAHSRRNGWIEVTLAGRRGFIPTNALLSKFDFVTSVIQDNDKKHLKTSGKTNATQNVQTIHTEGNRAIICELTSELNIHQRVKLLRETSTEWVQSKLPEHGLVWWKPGDAEKSSGKAPQQLTIEELLKRDVYSVSFHPQNEKIGLASAEGVYFTLDGQNWKKIDFFEEESHFIVHIHSDGSWFVGNYRSTDQGKNFKEFLQWDRITRIVQAAITRPPQYLKLVSLKTPTKGDLEMVLDTGYKKIHLISSTSGSTWLYKR